MKPRALAWLLLSHAGLALLGGWLARGEKPVATALPGPAAPNVASARPAGGAKENPILRATGADFAAAWDELLTGPRSSNGEPGTNSINFFVDWCAIDPEGAIEGLGRLHAPGFAHNYLGNAINYHGAILAPALAKHWRKLGRMPDSKVEYALGGALNALAKEDPERAAALTGDLPPGIRREMYRTLLDRLDLATIGRLLKGLPSLGAEATEEKARLWTGVAESVDEADSQRGLWDWLAGAEDPVARRALATEGMRKASRAEDWSGFFDAVERMNPSSRDDVRQVVREVARGSGHSPESRAAITAECRRHGLDDWLADPAPE